MVKWKEVIVEVEKAGDQIPLIDEVELLAHDRETGVKAIVDKSNMNTICVVKKDNQLLQH